MSRTWFRQSRAGTGSAQRGSWHWSAELDSQEVVTCPRPWPMNREAASPGFLQAFGHNGRSLPEPVVNFDGSPCNSVSLKSRSERGSPGLPTWWLSHSTFSLQCHLVSSLSLLDRRLHQRAWSSGRSKVPPYLAACS